MQKSKQAEISLRKFVMGDNDKIFQMSREGSMTRFLPDQVYLEIEEATKVLKSLIGFYDHSINPVQTPYVLGIILKGNELIGHIGLSKIDEGVEIGYAIEEKYQRRRYAQKAVLQMLRFVETNTTLREIFGIVDPENGASIKVLEKCGFVEAGSKAGKIIYKKILLTNTDI